MQWGIGTVMVASFDLYCLPNNRSILELFVIHLEATEACLLVMSAGHMHKRLVL